MGKFYLKIETFSYIVSIEFNLKKRFSHKHGHRNQVRNFSTLSLHIGRHNAPVETIMFGCFYRALGKTKI